MINKDLFIYLSFLLYLIYGNIYINYVDYDKINNKIIKNLIKKYDDYLLMMVIPILSTIIYYILFKNIYSSIVPIVYLHLLYFLIPKIFAYGNKYLNNKNILILYNIIVISISAIILLIILE